MEARQECRALRGRQHAVLTVKSKKAGVEERSSACQKDSALIILIWVADGPSINSGLQRGDPTI